MFFIFSSPISGKKSRLKKILENAGVGSLREREVALNTCAVDRIHKCYYLIMKALKDPGTQNIDDAIKIKNAAAVALVGLRVKDAIEPLKEAVQVVSKQIEEQKGVIQGLRKAPTSLVEILMAEDVLKNMYIAKSNMIHALGSVRYPKIIDYFFPFLKDKSRLVRMKAALSLSYMPEKKNQSLLEKHLTDEKNEMVQLEILRALLAIDRFNATYINSFLKMFLSNDHAVRKKLAKVGVQFQITEGREAVERAITLELKDDVSLEMEKYRSSILYH